MEKNYIQNDVNIDFEGMKCMIIQTLNNSVFNTNLHK